MIPVPKASPGRPPADTSTGLPPAQHAVMLWASGEPGGMWRQDEIADDLGYAKGTISLAHQGLRDAGLIEHIAGRRGYWRSTARGRSLCRAQGWVLAEAIAPAVAQRSSG